jgi:hypothetical protein
VTVTMHFACSHLIRKAVFNEHNQEEEHEMKNYCALGRFHNDAQYGHQFGEVNFWMPLTSVHKTSTLWAETSPSKGDW